MRGAATGPVRDAAEQIAMFTESSVRDHDPDTLNDGIALIYEGEHAALESCGEGSATDRALLLVGRLHAAGSP